MRILTGLLLMAIMVSLLSGMPSRASAADTANSSKLSSAPYIDPKGYFKIIPPAGWTPKQYPNDPRGKVDFTYVSGRNRIQLIVSAQKSTFSSFESLFADNQAGARRWGSRRGASLQSSRISMFGVPVGRFLQEIPGRVKLLQLHFLKGGNYYTLAVAGPPNSYRKFLSIAMKSIETFQPMFPDVKAEDAKKHVVASKIRTAKFLIKSGKKDYAREIINEGLGLEPGNKELIELKQQAEGTPHTKRTSSRRPDTATSKRQEQQTANRESTLSPEVMDALQTHLKKRWSKHYEDFRFSRVIRSGAGQKQPTAPELQRAQNVYCVSCDFNVTSRGTGGPYEKGSNVRIVDNIIVLVSNGGSVRFMYLYPTEYDLAASQSGDMQLAGRSAGFAGTWSKICPYPLVKRRDGVRGSAASNSKRGGREIPQPLCTAAKGYISNAVAITRPSGDDSARAKIKAELTIFQEVLSRYSDHPKKKDILSKAVRLAELSGKVSEYRSAGTRSGNIAAVHFAVEWVNVQKRLEDLCCNDPGEGS
ncbi:hypothetical protein ACFL2Q_13220 [Thermodesulfobacteriota bacterium]